MEIPEKLVVILNHWVVLDTKNRLLMKISETTKFKVLWSGNYKNGNWTSILTWSKNKDEGNGFQIFRKYDYPILCYGDGDFLAETQDHYLIDQNNIRTGAPTYYALFIKNGGKIHKKFSSVYAGIRRDDVFDINASKDTDGTINLYWKTKANLADCVVRRGFNVAPKSCFGGEFVEIIDPNCHAVDKIIDDHKKIYYSFWAVFKDPVHQKRQFSQGVSIEILVGNLPTLPVTRISQIILRCPYCKEPFGFNEKIITCNNCGIGYHIDCWEKSNRCIRLYCECRLGTEEKYI
ncbi:RING finger protein [Pelolinea submarina]|nr:RING finger protein [Pelolinea submarina]